MHGMLRIASARSPYLRAGLGWPSREPVAVDIRDLDGERLLALVRDPVLTVTLADEFGGFGPFPAISDDATPDQAQMMIDAIASNLPPVEAVSGFAAVDPAALVAERDVLRAERDALRDERDALRDRATMQAGEIMRITDALTEVQGDLREARVMIDQLRVELADAVKRAGEAPAKPARTKPAKPADT